MTKDTTLSELAVFAESLGRELAQAMLTSRLEEDPERIPRRPAVDIAQDGGGFRIQRNGG
ncbi:MAG: hypothetical protein IPN19_04960 [Elusimicrobia bacterium]|nr:hypothetical protein [Elusimicrobiota bacterium]